MTSKVNICQFEGGYRETSKVSGLQWTTLSEITFLRVDDHQEPTKSSSWTTSDAPQSSLRSVKVRGHDGTVRKRLGKKASMWEPQNQNHFWPERINKIYKQTKDDTLIIRKMFQKYSVDEKNKSNDALLLRTWITGPKLLLVESWILEERLVISLWP